MKKSYFKRGTSALLALIMCLTAMIGFGSTTAFAAGEEAEVAMFTFPRDGDANYGADWGHEAKHYMNGWTAGSVNGNHKFFDFLDVLVLQRFYKRNVFIKL